MPGSSTEKIHRSTCLQGGWLVGLQHLLIIDACCVSGHGISEEAMHCEASGCRRALWEVAKGQSVGLGHRGTAAGAEIENRGTGKRRRASVDSGERCSVY